MDIRSWKKVLLQWITECGFMERNYFNIEQTDIDVFYHNYMLQHQKIDPVKNKRLGDFLKEVYPSFDINLDDENCISSADYIYVYSLLLHYCCVKHPETLFHQICQKLPEYNQQCIAAFFKELLETEPITKEALRHAIAEVANTQSPPPRLNDSFSLMNITGGGQSATLFSRCESPLKTPKRSAGSQRVSPSTPKSNLLEERTREVYNLRAQLETERYEKGHLEVQIKQNEDKIQKLNYDHKKLLQQIQDLKNEIIVKSSDCSANRDGEENQVQKRLLKELHQREQEIIKLTDISVTLREERSLVEEKLHYAEQKIVLCMNRIKDLECKIDEFKEDAQKKNDTIEFLTHRKLELEKFINENRLSSSDHLGPDLNASTDCLDNSYIRSFGNNTNSSNSLSSPENLGASVVDVQLREKEHENNILKEELLNVRREHKRLAKELTKLTQDFAKPVEDSLSLDDERNDEDDYDYDDEESEEEQCVSFDEQFYVFNNCMEKINKYHKTEKNKVRQLEEATNNLNEENEDLRSKLQMLNEQVLELTEKQLMKASELQELEQSKLELQEALDKSQNDFLQLQTEKQALYSNLQSSETLKESLNQLLKELATKLEVQQKSNRELTTKNKDLEYTTTTSQTQLQDLQQELNTRTLELENEIHRLTNQMAEQIEELKSYQQMEKTLKNNNEHIMIQNDKLKKQARETDIHLSSMRKELTQKDNQMFTLAEQIANVTQKNTKLEENINRMLEKYKQDNLLNNNLKTNQDEQIQDLEKNIRKLKDDLTKTELLLESKQHECELKIQELELVKPKLQDIQKLFTNCENLEPTLNNLLQVEEQIKSLLEETKDTNDKLNNLEASQLESSNIIEKLQLELNEKSETIKQNSHAQQELSKLQKLNLEYEETIENLKEQQHKFIDQVQQDVAKKELELQERLKEAASEYDNSMERIGHELKTEKEQHNYKEMELLLLKAEHNKIKKQLTEKEENMEKLQEHCEKLKVYENKVLECSKENDKLRQEIGSFKEEVTENALRLIEADKALNEFMDLTKEQDSKKTEMENLEKSLQEKDDTIAKMEQQLVEHANCLEEIKRLQQDKQEKLDSIMGLQENLDKLTSDKEKILQTLEERSQEVQKEQQDKIVLLNTLEKTSDQLKLNQDENAKQKLNLEQQIAELKNQFDTLTLQNTKLLGDLVEREAELHQSQEEQQQENDKFQQKLLQKCEELESLDMALITILATMENNFNLSQDFEDQDVKELFKSNKDDVNESKNIQKLRKNLNYLLFSQQKLQQELQDLTLRNEEASKSFQTFKKSNNDLQLKLNQQDKILLELKEQLDVEELNMEKRVSQEVKRLEEDLLNLEKVNERLSQENVNIHVQLDDVQQEFKESKILLTKLEEDKLQLQEEVRSKSLALEKLQQEEKKLQTSLKEKSQYTEKISEKAKCLESQFKEKITKLQNLEKFCHDLKEKSQKSQQKLSHYQTQHQSQQVEQKRLQDKLKQIQTSNEALELDLAKKNKDLLALTNKHTETSQQLKEAEQQLEMTSKKLDKMLGQSLNAETQCEQLLSEKQQLKRDVDFLTSQQQSQHEELSRLNQEIESLKKDKQHLRDEIKETKLSLQMANDNVSQLIQQNSSMRLEKEATLEENQLFRKQLEETGKHQSSSETKLKTIIEKSQDFERKLLSTENELKSLKVQLDKSETISAKLSTENKKLKDTQEVATKRIEKLALKLGDSQARSSKLERDNEKLGKTLEANSATVEALQKEKDLLQSEAKSLKERLSRAERGHEQLAAKVHNLEHLNANLHEIKQKLEASELDGKTKLNKLEKMRETNEEKIRKLAASLNNAEHSNVKLNLEIGALNSQLQEIRTEHNQEQLQHEEELKQQLEQAQDISHRYEELNEKLKLELQQLKEENSLLNDQLSKASLSLNITKQRCEKLASEMEQIRADILIIRQEKSQVELQHETSMQKLSQFESQNTKLIYERKNLVKSLEQRIFALEEELAAKAKEVDDLQNEIEILKENSESHSSLIQITHTASLAELQQLQSKLRLADETMQKEQQLIAQLRLDNQILHTKYQESKQRALDAATTSEERIKENRLELEGKLEKMKNKMKTLYTEEITKMKTKQEREMVLIKSELEVQKTQNAKYEEHTRKLSNQIVRLNDNILEHQKENTMLSTKLKHIMEQQHHEAPVAAANNIGTNLAMEDEEGEVFNNTYLTDLKNGRMSELMNRDVCVEELKYRNSLLPPHLRSTYAAQYDHEFPEDDLKDGPHSFDDSMSALLSTTAGGTRKKCTGVTHYKRPGPPTPSKNGGRLSFGCSSEPGREILKESYDTNSGSSAVTSAKTPARFNFFASRFSMSNARDEKRNIKQEPDTKPSIKQEPEKETSIKQEPEMKPSIKQESGELNLRKALHKKNIKGNRKLLTGVGCTSTPRKSKVHYDQRRLLDQLMTSSPSPSPLSIEHKNIQIESKITPPDVSLIETPVTIFDRRDLLKAAPVHHIPNAKRMVAIAGGLRRNRRNSSMFGRRLSRRMQEICTPTSGETTSSAMSTPAVEKVKRQVVCTTVTTTSGGAGKSAVLQRRLRKRPKRERGTRPSLYLRGNIFAKYRTPNNGAIQDLNRYKSKKQRFDHFNKGRDINSFRKNDKCPSEIDKTISVKAMKDRTYDLKNNNYATFNHNILGETVVLSKFPSKAKQIEDTFTFAEEVFESHDTEELDYMEDYESDEPYDDEEEDSNDMKYGSDNDDMKYDFPLKKECCKQELITSQDLEAFDRFVAKSKVQPKTEDIDEDSYRSQGSSKQFEKLLTETESNAPFEVKHIQFNVTKSSHSSRSHSYQSSSLNQSHSIHSTSQDHDVNISTATPHCSPSNLHGSGQLSRTIYGGTVIYNHRLPHINTTYVRKSSIYVKNRNKSTGGGQHHHHHHHRHPMDSLSCNDDDVVLITNQTITFVDIMRMWSQMDSSTRIIVSFAILASFTTLLGLFVSFCHKR